jgi:hypothetical protein
MGKTTVPRLPDGRAPGQPPNRKATTMSILLDPRILRQTKEREPAVASLSAQMCANIALASLAIATILSLLAGLSRGALQ